MRLLPLLVACCFAAVLAAPAPAPAASWTVDPAASGCSAPGARVCRTLTEVAARVSDGDVVEVKPGRYEEPPVTFTKNDLVIAGAAFYSTGVVTSGDGPALKFTGRSPLVRGLHVIGTGTAAAEPALLAEDGIALRDAYVLSTRGPAIALTGGAAGRPNRIERSYAFASATSADAIRISSGADSAADKALVLDSVMVSGGDSGAGVRAITAGKGVGFSTAGDIAITARHLTSAGHALGIALDASAANGKPAGIPSATIPPVLDAEPAGSISATVLRSIVHGTTGNSARRHAGAGTSAPNTATLTFRESDASPAVADGSGTVELNGASFTPDARLWIAPERNDFHLRADAPLVDRVGGPEGDASTRDVNGDPRAVDGPDPDEDAQADLGADEWVNRLPTAALSVSDRTPKQGQLITFDASGSGDPEAAVGGGIAEYRWDLGDGLRRTTTTPTLTHAYRHIGAYAVSVRVVDRQGGASEPTAPVTVAVKDGQAPDLAFTSPRANRLLRLSTRPRRGRPAPPPRRLVLRGTASDESGIARVEVALRLVRRAGRSRPRSGRAAARCAWFDGRRRFRTASCGAPIWLRARIDDFNWSLATRRGLRLPPGRYEARARAVDLAGLRTPDDPAPGARVSFRVR